MSTRLVILVPVLMFGVAVSFFTLLAIGQSDHFVWPYAVAEMALTSLNLAAMRWRHADS